MDDCIFCKIVARTVPGNIVYEDDATLAFLDRSPNHPGHTLVIPKKHVRNIFDIDAASLSAVASSVQKVATAVKAGVAADGININMNNEPAAGQVVFHAHVHVIPRYAGDGFKFFPKQEYASEEEFAQVGEKIRAQFA